MRQCDSDPDCRAAQDFQLPIPCLGNPGISRGTGHGWSTPVLAGELDG